VADAAREWRASIEAARAGAHGSDRYLEIRYEELLAAPAAGVGELYRWLGLPVDDAILEGALAEAKVSRNLDPMHTPPGTGKWRRGFTPRDLDAFEDAAGELLYDLGYERMAVHGRGLRGRLLGLRRLEVTA
jgi:hypothetical protein